jgi:hypothetical protein
MRKIAIVKGREVYRDQYGDDGFYENIVQHITEWEEVDDEEYEFLKRGLNLYSRGEERYTIIEYVDQPRIVINRTVADYKKWLKQQEDERAAYQAERARKRAEALAKKALRSKTKEEDQLKKLAEKLGKTIV